MEPMVLKTVVPKKGFAVPGLPELNHSQVGLHPDMTGLHPDMTGLHPDMTGLPTFDV